MKTIIVVKVEQYGFTLPECIQKGGDGISNRPWSDCSLLANSVDPDQTAVWSGSTLFAQTYLSQYLEFLRYFDLENIS